MDHLNELKFKISVAEKFNFSQRKKTGQEVFLFKLEVLGMNLIPLYSLCSLSIVYELILSKFHYYHHEHILEVNDIVLYPLPG